MHHFVCAKRTAKVFLHDKSVLKDVSVLSRGRMIAPLDQDITVRVNHAAALPLVIRGTELHLGKTSIGLSCPASTRWFSTPCPLILTSAAATSVPQSQPTSDASPVSSEKAART